MKNILILITLTFTFSAQLKGQKGIAKKSTIDFSLDFKPVARFSMTTNDYVEGEFPDRIIPLVGLHAEYKFAVSSRLSLGLMYENCKADFGRYKYEEQNNDNSVYRNDVYSFNSPSVNTSYGISLNIYTKGFVAPVGNSFSFYYKRNLSKVKNVKYDYTIERNNVITAGTENSTLLLKAHTIGMSFNGMVFLSDEQPFYINYGLGFGILFGGNLEFNNKEIKGFDAYDGRRFENLRSTFFLSEAINFKVGIGYWL